MGIIGDLLNHYGKGSFMSKLIVGIVITFAISFVILIVLLLLNWGKIKKLGNLEFETEAPIHDTIVKYIPDTTETIKLPFKQPYYSPQDKQGSKKSQENQSSPSKFDIKGNNFNAPTQIGDSNTMINQMDIPAPQFIARNLTVNMKRDTMFFTSWEITVKYKGAIQTLALGVQGDYIIDIDAASVTSSSSAFSNGAGKEITKSQAIFLLVQPTNKILLDVYTSKEANLVPFIDSALSSY